MQLINCAQCGELLGYIKANGVYKKEPGDDDPAVVVDDALKVRRKEKHLPDLKYGDECFLTCPKCKAVNNII